MAYFVLQIPDVAVKVVPTKAAHFFFTSEQVKAEICTDEQEWAVSQRDHPTRQDIDSVLSLRCGPRKPIQYFILM